MHISFRQTGGFSGLARSAEINTEALAPDERRQVESLVAEARFFERSDPTPASAPDRELFEVRIESGETARTLHAGASSLPTELAPLIRHLQGKATYEKRTKP